LHDSSRVIVEVKLLVGIHTEEYKGVLSGWNDLHLVQSEVNLISDMSHLVVIKVLLDGSIILDTDVFVELMDHLAVVVSDAVDDQVKVRGQEVDVIRVSKVIVVLNWHHGNWVVELRDLYQRLLFVEPKACFSDSLDEPGLAESKLRVLSLSMLAAGEEE
jgi:hypothetical protein